MTGDAVAWRNTRPKKRMGAGVLMRDSRGWILLVEPTYKPLWEIPGGAVEVDESPRLACSREVEEELGLARPVGRLLCIEWQGPEQDRTESMMLVYDGGVLSDPGSIRLPFAELRAFEFVHPSALADYLEERLVRRVGAAIAALAGGTVAELEHGVQVEVGASLGL